MTAQLEQALEQSGLGIPSLCVIGALILSAFVAAWYACRAQKLRTDPPDPELKKAVADHWETTPEGRRIFRGATFKRPGKTERNQ